MGVGGCSTSLLTEASSRLCALDDSVVFLLGWKKLPMIPHSVREASSVLRRIGVQSGQEPFEDNLFWECPGSDCILIRLHLIPYHTTSGEFMCSALFTFYVIITWRKMTISIRL